MRMDCGRITMSVSANHLKDEESPYLKQHATNPVDWYPWGEEAFDLAKKLDKPVFLSIGYSTCHWCHVMERESFSKPQVGRAMNEAFVCIKVDREERPDVDSLYMSIAIRERGSGGWPLNMILTPDKKPITSFTYLPIHSLHGNIGIIELSETIKTLWKDERESLLERADQLISSNIKEGDSERVKVDTEKLFKHAFTEMKKIFDYEYGGIGNRMKFPSPHNIIFLIKYYNYFRDEEALQMAENTLLAMRRGGIFDHVGYGFHRYSTDREWKIPHFEKMLYDQAWTMMAYSYAYATTKKDFYKIVINEIFEFLQREMKSPDGGYYTAIDADSEGIEGKYYLWTENELKNILKDDFEEFKNIFDIETKGNFINERDGMDTGLNNIYPKYESFLKDKTGNSLQWMNDDARKMLHVLLQNRSNRVRPETDTKVIASTNGMILSAFCTAYLATFDKKYKEASTDLFAYIKSNFIIDNKILRISYNNRKQIHGFLEDYANVLNGVLQYYRVNLDEEVLRIFTNHIKYSIENFRMKNGVFDDRSEVLYESKSEELYDGAIPNPHSVFLRNTAFYALISDDYELATYSIEVDQDLKTQLFKYSGSYLWYITSLFEILNFIVIKIPLKIKKTRILSGMNHLYKTEKIIRSSIMTDIQICNLVECIYSNLDIEKLEEI